MGSTFPTQSQYDFQFLSHSFVKMEAPILEIFDTMKSMMPPAHTGEGIYDLSFFSDDHRSSIADILEKRKLSYTAEEARVDRYLLADRRLRQIEKEERFSKLHDIGRFLLDLPVAVDDVVYRRNDMKDQFLRHLANSIALLLAGPPGAGEHTIDTARAAEWVAAQKSTVRREVAQKLIDNVRYITHAQLLTGLQECVSKVAAQCDFSRPVILLTGLPKKSNYYISLLFAHFWQNAGHPIHYVLEHVGKIDTDMSEEDFLLHTTGNLLDIDDMAYSGTQTFQMIVQNFDYLTINGVNEILTKNLLTSPSQEDQIKFYGIPPFYYEFVLREKMKLNYILCRPFCSSEALELFRGLEMRDDDGVRKYCLPLTLVINELIPSAKNLLGPQNVLNATNLFTDLFNFPATTVYTNHKVANAPSTFLSPLADGVIPGGPINYFTSYVSGKLGDLPHRAMYANNGTVLEGPTEYKRFIKGCMNGPRPKYVKKLGMRQVKDSDRCPSAWYKEINYNTGTYTPPVRRTRRGRRNTHRKTRRN